MIEIRLERSDGNYLKLSLPENATQLSLSQKIDFDLANMDLISYLTKHEDNLFKNRAGYLLALARAVSRTFEVDLADILNLKGESLLDMREVDFYEHLEKLTKKVKRISKAQIEKSLIDIWAYMTSIVNSATEGERPDEIEYKGEKYKLPEVDRHPTTGEVIHKSITYKQALEAIQVNNQYETWLRNNAEQHGSQTHGGLLFTKVVSEIVLLLHVDEIPIGDDEFLIWFNQKILHWQDIDWQNAYWLESWFTGYIEELRKNPENTYFFESTFEASTPEEREAELRAKAKGRKIYQKVGMKSVTAQLLELNPFQKEGRSKLESIMRAPFTQIVNLISTHNART